MTRYFRALATDISGEPGMPIRFEATTDEMARDKLIIELDGWQLENYRANPVFLWAHDYRGDRLPIGRSDVTDWPDIAVIFDQADEFARRVERKYRDGFLNTVSVGWDTIEKEGNRITRAELLDISAVPVPADPGALMERQRIGLRSLRAGLDELLNDEDGFDAEASWIEASGRMAALFGPNADDSDECRFTEYKALLPKYRRLGKEPPEFRTMEEIAVLTPELWRGLFLEGEIPEPVDTRHLAELKAAYDALGNVIEQVEAGGEQETPDDDDGAAMAVLEQLSQQLEETNDGSATMDDQDQ